MPENRPAFPFFPKDWLASTRGLSGAARGYHIDMLALAWLNGGCDADPETLRRSVGAEKAEWRRVWPELSTRWQEVDGRLVNPRLERVREEATAYTEAKRLAGKMGGKAKAERLANGKQTPSKELAEGLAEDVAEGLAKPSLALASASAKKKRTPQPPKGEWRSDPLFVLFYEAYPRREAPKAAFRAWAKLNADEPLLQRLLAALKWQIPAHDWGPHNAYTPLPATWLNAGRWDDTRDTRGPVNGVPLAPGERPAPSMEVWDRL